LTRQKYPETYKSQARWTIGCVSYLNSKPLIEPILRRQEVRVHFAVPAALSDLLNSGQVNAALLPIVDYQNSPRELLLVPAGMIGSDGPTLTVRIFSRVTPRDITHLHVDAESHTSIILARIILQEAYGTKPELLTTAMDPQHRPGPEAQAMLLIGDKVVNASPSGTDYPYQLDLGLEWKKLTGLPFAFAMWMMPADASDPELAEILAAARRQGSTMTEELVARYADPHRWPHDLTRRYFTEHLRYRVTAECRRGIERFYELAQQNSLLNIRRPIRYMELESSG
jgi:chorismate dehydratase